VKPQIKRPAQASWRLFYFAWAFFLLWLAERRKRPIEKCGCPAVKLSIADHEQRTLATFIKSSISNPNDDSGLCLFGCLWKLRDKASQSCSLRELTCCENDLSIMPLNPQRQVGGASEGTESSSKSMHPCTHA
jgi:hypothetical protein